MKTIMITISKGLIVRNLLQNDFYDLLKKHFDRVIILTTAVDSRRFLEEFKDHNVLIIPLIKIRDNFFGKIIANINRYIIYNDGTEMLTGHDFEHRRDIGFVCWRFKHLVFRSIFIPLSRITLLRKLLRSIDYLFLHHDSVRKYRMLIKKYKPNIIFTTNIMDEADAVLLKAARKEGVKTLGMVKSWDNFSKKYFRAHADRLAVWNEFMFEQAQVLQDYKRDEIEKIGVPQFDYYTDKSRLLSREDFCKKAGLNPKKKIIFFGSEGKLLPTDSNIVGILQDFIVNQKLVDNCQIFVRPHWAYTDDRKKFKDFFDSREVIVDSFHNFSSGFSDSWDYSREQMDYFLSCIYHSSIIINTASSLTLDAIAMNKPVILIMFDGGEKKSRYESVSDLYTSDYYKKVVSFSVAFEAKNVSSLKDYINQCLRDPDSLRAQQEKFKQYFCHLVDGKSGKRLFDLIYDTTK